MSGVHTGIYGCRWMVQKQEDMIHKIEWNDLLNGNPSIKSRRGNVTWFTDNNYSISSLHSLKSWKVGYIPKTQKDVVSRPTSSHGRRTEWTFYFILQLLYYLLVSYNMIFAIVKCEVCAEAKISPFEVGNLYAFNIVVFINMPSSGWIQFMRHIKHPSGSEVTRLLRIWAWYQ